MRFSTNTASAMTSRGCKGLAGDVEALKKLGEEVKAFTADYPMPQF